MKWRTLWRNSAMYIIAVVMIALDQWTKYLVRLHLPLNRDTVLIPWLDGLFTFTHVQNTGGSFGILPGLGWPFILVAVAVVVVIILYARRLPTAPWILRIAFGLQLAGALGNMVDRVAYGYVTDFINFRWWPVWNVADACIVIGTILLLYYTLFLDRPEPHPTAAAEESTGETGSPAANPEQ